VSHSASSCARRLRASAIATATARRDSSVHVGRRRTPSPAHHVLIFANAKWPDDAIRWPCGRPRLSAYWGLRSPAYASTSTWTRKTGRSCSSTPASSALRASCRSGLAADIAAGPAAIGSNARTRSSQELEVTRWAGASSSRRPRYGKKHATFEASFLIVTAHASDQPFEHPAMHANRAAQRWTPVPQQCRNRARR
jgi:hypothetical protein